MNSISLTGRFTADPELKSTPNGVSVCSFTIAVQRPRVKDTTDFIRCVAWRSSAEFISRYFCKGKMIAITGILTTRTWKDENNNTHNATEVVVDHVEFCGDNKKPNEGSADDVPPDYIYNGDDPC